MPKPKLVLNEAEHRLLLIRAVGRCGGGCSDGCGGTGIMNLVTHKNGVGVYETPDPEKINNDLDIDIHGTYYLTVKNDEEYRGPLPTKEAAEKGLAAFRKHLNKCPIYRAFGGADLPLQEGERGNEKVYYCPHYRQQGKIIQKINESELELSE